MLISCKIIAREPLLRFSADVGVLSSSTGSLLTAAGEMVSSGFAAVIGEMGGSDAAIVRASGGWEGRVKSRGVT